ncbi:MAG: FtsW/RodA/SpoVE family cell cycle protein [Rikenellaceae bacterium]|jgi:cell division protein FtsW|nr:FtsW/RodA/SpoVE family cell cycle protein [Rikenellaceae bacterium]
MAQQEEYGQNAQAASEEESPRGLFAGAGPVLAGDKTLWVIIVILCIISLLVVYSATNSKAYADAGGDTAHYMLNQLKYIIMGLGIIYVVHRIDYQVYARFAGLAFVVALGLQLLTFFLGVDLNGAKRALQIPLIGLTFQPSDFLKVTLVMVLARQLAQRQTVINKIKLLPSIFAVKRHKGKRSIEFDLDLERNAGIWRSTTMPLLLPVAVACAVIMPSNLSTSGIVFFSCWIMLYIGRAKMSELIRLLTLTVVAGAAVIMLMSAFNIARGRTWMGRIKQFTGIERVATTAAADTFDPDDEQAENARIAIASGGIFGKGPGRSTQRARLSHSYSDFAYAFIVEEYGVFGAMAVLMLYLWLFFRTIVIFQRCGTAFPSLLVLGLGLMIFFQAAINMLVSTGLFFVTGQNLPLISMGGSSVIFISLALGMILGVSRQMQEKTLDAPKSESLLESTGRR